MVWQLVGGTGAGAERRGCLHGGGSGRGPWLTETVFWQDGEVTGTHGQWW